jgi:hypothetical protein
MFLGNVFNTPKNSLPHGRINKGRRGRRGRQHWREAGRQRPTQARLANRRRTVAAHRKRLHGQLAHAIVRQGNTFVREKVSDRAWQRRYGRSIQQRAPATVVEILTRLAASGTCWRHATGITVPTRSTKLSQTCHCGRSKIARRNRSRCACTRASTVASSCSGISTLPPCSGLWIHTPPCSLLPADHAEEACPGAQSLLRCGRRGSRPLPPSNRHAAERLAPPTCGGARLPCVRAGRPQQAHQPRPSARMLERHVRESRTAEAVVWARTSPIDPGARLRVPNQ